MMKPLHGLDGHGSGFGGGHAGSHGGRGGGHDGLVPTASLALANRAAKEGSLAKVAEPVYNNECFLLVFLLCQYMRYREIPVKSKLFTMLIRCYER